MPVLSGFEYIEGEPHLVIDDMGERQTKRKTLPIRDQEFSMKFNTQKYCVGSYDIETFLTQPCPKQSKISPNYERCYSCNQLLQFNPAFYQAPLEQLSPKQKKYNTEPHNVYLAYFSKDNIKVGIANNRRTQTRLLEQGARAALIIKRFKDVYEARALEEKISSTLGITESMRVDQKRKLLSTPYDFKNATQDLIKNRDLISSKLKIDLDQESPLDFQNFYLGKNQLGSGLEDISSHSDITLKGTGIGMIGDIFILKNNNKTKLLSLKKLIGFPLLKL